MVCDKSCVGNPCLLGMQKCEMGVKWKRIVNVVSVSGIFLE